MTKRTKPGHTHCMNCGRIQTHDPGCHFRKKVSKRAAMKSNTKR